MKYPFIIAQNYAYKIGKWHILIVKNLEKYALVAMQILGGLAHRPLRALQGTSQPLWADGVWRVSICQNRLRWQNSEAEGQVTGDDVEAQAGLQRNFHCGPLRTFVHAAQGMVTEAFCFFGYFTLILGVALSMQASFFIMQAFSVAAENGETDGTKLNPKLSCLEAPTQIKNSRKLGTH